VVPVLILSIIAIAFLIMLGAALDGMASAAFGGLRSIVDDLPAKSWFRTSGAREVGSAQTGARVLEPGQAVDAAETPELSTEALWHRIQGTSPKSRARVRRS
jgi:hypothetical protein